MILKLLGIQKANDAEFKCPIFFFQAIDDGTSNDRRFFVDGYKFDWGDYFEVEIDSENLFKKWLLKQHFLSDTYFDTGWLFSVVRLYNSEEIPMNRIKELREQNHWSQKELGLRAEISPQSISQYERDGRKPKIDVLKRLAFVFHCSVPYLIGEEDYCPYCEPDESKRKALPIGDDDGMTLGDLDGNEDFAEISATYLTDWVAGERKDYRIKYCPMCGRELER